MFKILVVEDDPICAGVIEDLLTHHGYTVEHVADGTEGVERLRFYQYDLAVLDWELPGESGPKICQFARQSGLRIPILMLTGKGAIESKEEGFESGADDYLTKPFDSRELMARVRALLRRPGEISPETIVVGGLSLNMATRQLMKESTVIELLPREFALLCFLMRHPNQIFAVDDLLNRVWSSESETSVDGLRKCVERLRKKIDELNRPSMIETVHRVGYVFRA